MQISKQPSGGRGEYELVGVAPNGLRPHDLKDCSMLLRFGQHVIATSLRLRNAQGKWRLRVDGRGRLVHVPYQTANILMMPEPIRDEQKMEAGLPVLQTEHYIISHVHLNDGVRPSGDDTFTADVVTVEYRNQPDEGLLLPVASRIADIEAIWGGRDRFPGTIPALLKQHEDVVRQGTMIPGDTTKLVRDVQRQLAEASSDLDIEYAESTDPVPALLEILALASEAPLVPPDQIDPEQADLRRRVAKQWEQRVSRGASGVNFRRRVREAYNARCVMCGSRFPPIGPGRNPGVDSAHILPWSKVELDEVYNGLALCKLHHWAFDEGLLTIGYEDSAYVIRMPADEARALADAGASADDLRSVVGRVPPERLPAARSDWPRPDLLARRGEIIG